MDRDKIFVEKVKEAVSILDEIDAMIGDQGETLQRIDFELSDYYHLIENEDLNEKQSYKVVRKIKELRKIRHCLNNENYLENTYQQQKSKLTGNQTRQFLIAEIIKTEKALDSEYKNRVLDADALNYIFEEPKKKAGRPKKEKELE